MTTLTGKKLRPTKVMLSSSNENLYYYRYLKIFKNILYIETFGSNVILQQHYIISKQTPMSAKPR